MLDPGERSEEGCFSWGWVRDNSKQDKRDSEARNAKLRPSAEQRDTDDGDHHTGQR